MNNIDAAFAKIDAAITAPRATAVAVGTRFDLTESRGYNRGQSVHTITTRREVVSVDAVGFDVIVLEVLSETGRPEFASTPTRGSMAWFGFDAAVKAGRVEIVSAR